MPMAPSYPRKEVGTSMADEPDVPDLGMDDAALDDPAFDELRAALRELDFLHPNAPLTETIPADVAARIDLALAQESALRSADLHDNVVALASAGAPATGASSRRSGPAWGGILVASSVAVLAVVLGVGVLRGSGSSSTVVAGDAVGGSVAATSAPAAEAFAAPAPSAADGEASLDAGVLAAPQRMSFAGMVPPTRMLVDSDVDYTSAALPQQVSTVMDDLEVPTTATSVPATELVADPMPAGGFTSSAEALRNCITKLTKAAASTVMLVDRSTFEGQDAGVVVAPEPPPSTLVRVWVVDPDCNVIRQINIEIEH
jgi:hypothetical protein